MLDGTTFPLAGTTFHLFLVAAVFFNFADVSQNKNAIEHLYEMYKYILSHFCFCYSVSILNH